VRRERASHTWIALFRGINVGGNNLLPMKTLPALLAACGCTDANTYIQSGNAVFRSAETDPETIAARIGKAVEKRHGFEPRVLVLSPDDLARAMAGNPYAEAAAKAPKWVHLFFFSAGDAPPKAGLEKLKAWQTQGEQFTLRDKVFYLHTPNGFGTSKLAANVGRALGVDAITARNWNTCEKVLEMARHLGP
jgi:uncharacterized protein (DUF1697 family)